MVLHCFLFLIFGANVGVEVLGADGVEVLGADGPEVVGSVGVELIQYFFLTICQFYKTSDFHSTQFLFKC